MVDVSTQFEVMKQYHYSFHIPNEPHKNFHELYKMLLLKYFWFNMADDIKRFVECCRTCYPLPSSSSSKSVASSRNYSPILQPQSYSPLLQPMTSQFYAPTAQTNCYPMYSQYSQQPIHSSNPYTIPSKPIPVARSYVESPKDLYPGNFL